MPTKMTHFAEFTQKYSPTVLFSSNHPGNLSKVMHFPLLSVLFPNQIHPVFSPSVGTNTFIDTFSQVVGHPFHELYLSCFSPPLKSPPLCVAWFGTRATILHPTFSLFLSFPFFLGGLFSPLALAPSNLVKSNHPYRMWHGCSLRGP